MKQRLKRFFQEQVIPQLFERFSYRSRYQVPGIVKVVISRGVSGFSQSSRGWESFFSELATLVVQQIIVTRSRNSIAGFKIREKIPVGLIVSLRRERIYAFFDRFVNLALPRIRDFQGVRSKGFDGLGNYSLGLEEQLIFPEIRYDQVDSLRGIGLSIVTTLCTNEEGFVLLRILGIPFQN
jgi:large subunit ribosomal protein L5